MQFLRLGQMWYEVRASYDSTRIDRLYCPQEHVRERDEGDECDEQDEESESDEVTH